MLALEKLEDETPYLDGVALAFSLVFSITKFMKKKLKPFKFIVIKIVGYIAAIASL